MTTLDHQVDWDWRHVVIPPAAKSTGYWDEDGGRKDVDIALVETSR